MENVLKRPSHTFVPARGSPWRDVKTRESQDDTQVLCNILIQKSTENYEISLKCELSELFEGKELLKQKCLEPNVIRGGYSKNKKIICCQKLNRSWTSKN